jgi:hypothetical protein
MRQVGSMKSVPALLCLISLSEKVGAAVAPFTEDETKG